MRLLSTSGRNSLLQIHSYWERLPFSTKVLANGYKPSDVEHSSLQHDVRPPSGDPERTATGDQQQQQRCSFILPPPNVTGDLHLGHALMCTIQDVIARHRRRCGDDVCWIPGTDHAGIATQVVVEKTLRAQHPALSRQQLGRDRFLAEVWRWRNSKANRIRADLQRLGATCDWRREYFTMDAQQSRAVRAAFVRLFDEGLLYRDGRLVNWSCALESTISDIEVDVVPVPGRTRLAVPGYAEPVVFGEMTELAYAVVCDAAANTTTWTAQQEVVVATTRPETVLGDVAVAVHPDDPRYAHLRDPTRPPTFLWHSLRSERIPLLYDDAVDPEFGTGAVKITPAHDRFDYELARRHGLRTDVSVIDERGAIAPGFGELSGVPRFVARDRIRQQLAELGLLRGVREHRMQLPVCSRSRDVVELLVRPQWFVRCAEMSAEAQRAVREGELRLEPAHFEADWDRWLAEARDWCVSRQLWWGHRVPAYECEVNGGRSVWVAADDEQEARQKAAKVLAVADLAAIRVRQDPDVLDTWFSAALLPFAALGWPETDAPDFQRYYPHNLLVTGHDILFFWVARMVMLGQRLTGRVPFDRVLLHGIVCDAQGRKMSKSLGNVLSPAQVIEGRTLAQLQAQTDEASAAGVLSTDECQRSKRDQARMFPTGIAECGTDALRFTLCGHNVRSHFVAFDVGECYTNKLFFNKIWQATRFTVAACERWPVARGGRTGAVEEAEEDGRLRLTTMDRWILSRLARTRQTVRAAIDAHQFHVATAALKTFFYQNLCDVYVETSKAGVADTARDRRRAIGHCAVLSACLRRGLAELAPFAPFVSAELLRYVSERRSATVFAGDEDEESGAQWLDEQLEQDVEEMLAICAAIRQLKSERNITRKHGAEVHVYITDPELLRRLQQSHTDDMRVLSLSTAVRFSDEPLRRRSPTEDAVMVAQSTAGAHCTFGLVVSAAVAEVLQQQQQQHQSVANGNSGSTVNDRKLQKLEQDLHKLESTVANEGFRRAASAKVQQQHKEKIERIRSELASIRQMG